MVDEIDVNEEMERAAQEQPHDDQADMKERMLRLAAEFDNYKKRTRSDIEKAKDAGKAEMLNGILPVLDEFELALLSIGTMQDKSVVKGIEMVYSNFLDALKKDGVKEVPAVGAFDPYKHEIVMSRPDGKDKPGTILEVIKKGYMINGVLLRPASVIVAKEEEDKK